MASNTVPAETGQETPNNIAEVKIPVFRGDPVDLQKTRHTGIHIDFSNGKLQILVHAAGDPGFFQVEIESDYDPESDKSCVRNVFVATIEGPSKASILETLMSTPVNNRPDAEWNCHNWVADALTRFVAQDWITQQQRSMAISTMLDVTLEAADEEK